MQSFSQRTGLKPATKSIQRESIDVETRNALWSILYVYYQRFYKEEYSVRASARPYRRLLEKLLAICWTDYFKKAVDTIPADFDVVVEQYRTYFYSAQWNECLDFLEFTVQSAEPTDGVSFSKKFSEVLKKECCAYTFVGGLVTEITSEAEITAIDSAIQSSTNEVSDHLVKSLRFLSDRITPDYHNSIKESVSAIEAAARQTSGDKGATLTDALKLINSKTPMHAALTKMLTSLYGYAGDEGGVRHANKENGKPVSQDEARLILILASATTSYLTAKRS